MTARYFSIALCIFFLCGFSSCYDDSYFSNSDDVSISIRESDEVYKMSASFDERKTRMVKNYISDYTGDNGLFKSGGNVVMDAETTFGDNINVYIKFRPGQLKIKLDKDENSEQAYREVKDMCEGIRELLADHNSSAVNDN
jgi:hypothetical protein